MPGYVFPLMAVAWLLLVMLLLVQVAQAKEIRRLRKELDRCDAASEHRERMGLPTGRLQRLSWRLSREW